MDRVPASSLRAVVPMLQVNDMREALLYYQQVFGFSTGLVWPDEQQPKWAVVSRDGVQFLLTVDLGTSTGDFIAEKGNGIVLYIVAHAIEALYEELVNHGAIVVQELTSFGDRQQFSVADLNGYVLAFTTAIA